MGSNIVEFIVREEFPSKKTEASGTSSAIVKDLSDRRKKIKQEAAREKILKAAAKLQW